MNIILTIIAFILVAILTPFGVLFNFLFNWKNRSKYFFQFAVSLDQLGNVTCQFLLNLTMLKGDYYPFGNEDETVSSVLGKNLNKGTLTLFGAFITWLLNTIDKGHTDKAIEEDELH